LKNPWIRTTLTRLSAGTPTSQQWIFNITSGNLTAGNTYVYAITLNDGTIINFQYGLR
jgi:hypothetical protein